MRKTILLTSLIFLMPLVAKAAPLKIVNVAAPAINCVFSTSCSISVKDTTENVTLAAGGIGKLRSRTFKGAEGSPAAGLFGYEYRLELDQAVEFTALSCIDAITISFGPVISTLNYGGDSKPDQVFVVSKGGIGTIGLASAVQTRSSIKFKFTSPVCGGTSSGKGGSTFFWGLASKNPPTNVTATVHEINGVTRVVKARSPM
jgi:hypothetical protein